VYRGDIINELLKVTQLQLERCTEPDCRTLYQDEYRDFLQKLLEHTGDSFCHYRLGLFLLSIGDRAAAQQSFAAAYATLPETSIYKAPAGKLANTLKKP
jgi:hypothetical protein